MSFFYRFPGDTYFSEAAEGEDERTGDLYRRMDGADIRQDLGRHSLQYVLCTQLITCRKYILP
jgi:hypothetical protein